ncbi:MAG: hypothetical protein WDZ79_01630 [Candidatus Paceibacterota bacterium]
MQVVAEETLTDEQRLFILDQRLQYTLMFGHHNIWYFELNRKSETPRTPYELSHHFKDGRGMKLYRDWFSSLTIKQKWLVVKVALPFEELDRIIRLESIDDIPNEIRDLEKQLFRIIRENGLPELRA